MPALVFDEMLKRVLKPLFEKQAEAEVWAAQCCGRTVLTGKAPETQPVCNHCHQPFQVQRVTPDDLKATPE